MGRTGRGRDARRLAAGMGIGTYSGSAELKERSAERMIRDGAEVCMAD